MTEEAAAAGEEVVGAAGGCTASPRKAPAGAAFHTPTGLRLRTARSWPSEFMHLPGLFLVRA